jgi:hypothetical protein
MNDERFFDLAMKVIARQCTDAERAELDALLAREPELQTELARLQAEVCVAKEALPLVNATDATAGELPAYARGRLQTKVRQTLGRPTTEKESRNKLISVLLPSLAPGLPVKGEMPTENHKKMFLRWYWWFGLAAATALVVLVVLPGLRTPSSPVIQVAMLDTVGVVRGSDTNDTEILKQQWNNSTIQVFDKIELLENWETNWPGASKVMAKVIYDRAAGEVRVMLRRGDKSQQKIFVMEQNLATTMHEASNFIREQTRQ